MCIICLDYELRTSIDQIKNGLTLKRKEINDIQQMTVTDHADDLELFANTPDKAESQLRGVEKVLRTYIYVNANKTDFIYFKLEGAITTLSCKPLKLVDQFTYIGSYISSAESNVNVRLAKA